MNKKTKEQTVIIPMKCAVCSSCYRYADSKRPDKCHFGGPYLGYRYTEDGL